MVISNEFIHDYENTLELFNDIDIKDLNISECAYCENRVEVAAVAAIGLKKFKKAKELIELFPPGFKDSRSNVVQIRYFANKKEFNEIENIVSQVIEANILSNARFTPYYAARELYLTQNFNESEKYSDQVIELFSGEENFAVEWSYFFKKNYSKAYEILQR